ncbi:hypothetical protein [Reticulibacter mediterranei]|uniref:hypothetical protein n=1 Tax=Reticulibacter mediterranei TaxID=2778369 RepID=UPI001C692763|nr:hypothetical protein [Reticulibacter mediterranei]
MAFIVQRLAQRALVVLARGREPGNHLATTWRPPGNHLAKQRHCQFSCEGKQS